MLPSNCPQLYPRWQGVTVHHSACTDSPLPELFGIAEWHKRKGWLGGGYHLVVEQLRDRVVALCGRPLYLEGAHCLTHNRTHLGVCFVGNFAKTAPSEAMLLTGAAAIAGLCHLAKIPLVNVRAHREQRRTQCPGALFPMDRFRNMLADSALLCALVAAPLPVPPVRPPA